MPARVTVLCSYERESSLTVPLIKWVCKWELVNCQGNLTKLVRGVGIPNCFFLQETGVKLCPDTCKTM